MIWNLFSKMFYGSKPLMMDMIKYIEHRHIYVNNYRTPIYNAIYNWNEYNNIVNLIIIYKTDMYKLTKINKCINQAAFSVNYDNRYNIFPNKEKERRIHDLIDFSNKYLKKI